MFALMLPALAYYIPGFNPFWVKLVPSYYMLGAAKESILVSGDAVYTLMSCGGPFLSAAFCYSYLRTSDIKKSLTV